MVGAVLVHDRQPLDPVGARPGLGDIDDLGVEVAVLARDPLVDRIGDLMRHAPPVVGHGLEPQAAHLHAGEHVPQAELDIEQAIPFADAAGDQRLGIDQPPIGKARQGAQLLGRLDEGAPVDRPEQAGALEIGADHVGDLTAALLGDRGVASELADRDRQRLQHTFGDVEFEHGVRPARPPARSRPPARHQAQIEACPPSAADRILGVEAQDDVAPDRVLVRRQLQRAAAVDRAPRALGDGAEGRVSHAPVVLDRDLLHRSVRPHLDAQPHHHAIDPIGADRQRPAAADLTAQMRRSR